MSQKQTNSAARSFSLVVIILGGPKNYSNDAETLWNEEEVGNTAGEAAHGDTPVFISHVGLALATLDTGLWRWAS